MCLEYVKAYFKPSDTEALSKYFEENHHKLKFYIDEQGNPNFQDILRDRITRIKIKDGKKKSSIPASDS